MGPRLLAEFVLPDPEHSGLTRMVLVLGYLTAALCWHQAVRRAKRSPDGPFVRVWMTGAILLLLLAVSKALDLRTLCEMFIRRIAHATGWYEQRQQMQFFLALVLPAMVGLLLGTIFLTKARQFFRHQPLALAGWLLLFIYLACRQSLEWKPALHWLTSMRYFSWRLLLEVAGIASLILAAHPAPKPPQY